MSDVLTMMSNCLHLFEPESITKFGQTKPEPDAIFNLVGPDVQISYLHASFVTSPDRFGQSGRVDFSRCQFSVSLISMPLQTSLSHCRHYIHLPYTSPSSLPSYPCSAILAHATDLLPSHHLLSRSPHPIFSTQFH